MFLCACVSTLYFVILLIPADTVSGQVCRDWDIYKDNCYKFVARSLTVKGQTWEDAEINCESYGGHLASIANQDEQNFITNKIKPFQNERFWIGYNDRANETYFNWTDGLTGTNYTNWRKGEPNDWKGEDCAEVVFNNGLWNDDNCANTFSYICKRKKGDPWPTQATVSPPVTQKPIYCGAGWDSYGTSCYKFTTATKTWSEASKDCRKSGGYLVKVDNDDEQHFLSYRIRMLKQPMWIGLNDRAVEGTYVWEGDNTKVNYTNWFPGEPNDYSGKEDCIQIYNGFYAGFWNDQYCGKLRPYICEIPQGQSLCPANWVPYGDSCLEFNTHPAQALAWSQARDACKTTQGADLMSILSQDDQIFLWQQLQDLRSWNIWIGLNDMVKEGLFVWSDRSSFTFNNWAPNEPGSGVLAAAKDCVLLVPNVDNGTWATQNCSYQRPYVCKRNRGHDQCNSPLGMQTLQITDLQITASSMRDGPSSPTHARLNLQSSSTSSGAWCAGKNAKGEYLQIDLGLVRKITHIALQGRPKSKEFVSSFYIRYGSNGQTFVNYGENATQSYAILMGSKSSDAVANVMLPDAINCRFLRIYPVTWNTSICIRTEVYGCDGQATSTKCRAGWEEGPDNTCYQFNSNRFKIWADARASCTSQGGDLLSIVTNNERIYIDNRMKSLASSVNSFWIGLNDRESNRMFQWSDMSPFVVTRWDAGYPKDKTNAKACVELVPSRLAWRDIDCGQYKTFICKKKLGSSHAKKFSLTANWISATDAYWPLDGLVDGKALGTIIAQVFGNVTKAPVLHNKKSALQLRSDNGSLQAGQYPNQCIGDADACSTGLSVAVIVNLYAPASTWAPRTFLVDTIGDSTLVSSRGFAIYVEQSQVKVTVFTTKTSWAVSSPLSRGVWHHVAFTWLAGLGLQLYIDGKQKTTDKSGTIMTPTHTSNNYKLTVGSTSTTTAQGMYYMRSLAMWQRMLDPSEVLDIYNAEFGICSIGWKEYGQFCYQFNSDKKTWQAARTNCQNQGGELVSITSPVEQAHISLEIGYFGLNGFAWIGFHDKSLESVWEWTDGSPTRFTNWNNYQPDNYYWHGEDCGHVYHYWHVMGRWNDITCSTNMGSICKRKKVPPTAAIPSLPSRQQIICEWSSGSLNCPSSTVISIQKANYGRTSKTTCGTISITNCLLNVTKKLQRMCDGTTFCSVNPTNFLFGKDPCPSIRKYLDVTYSCNKGTVSTPQCPAGWQRSPDGNVCYGLMLDKKNWIDARASCKKNGAELVSIHSGWESAIVTSLLVTSWDAGDIWIGLTDQGQRGVYRWSDSSTVGFTHWWNGQPNDRKASGSCVRATMTISSRDWMYWKDDDCSSKNLAYVCKMFRHGLTPPTKAPTTVPVGPCPAGWTTYSFGCYRVFMTRKTWTSARDACRKFTKTDLVSIHSTAENTFVQTLTNSTFDAWIGLNDRGILSGHVWTDGTAVRFTKWGPVQPDSHSGQQPCVVFASIGYWNDVGCFSTRPYICKMKRPASAVTTKPPTAAPTLPTAAPGTCDAGWRYYNKKCYFFSHDTVKTRLSWFNARTACKKLGGDLVSLLNAAENAYVFSIAKQVFYSWTIWIGLNDLGTESNYHWSDGSPFSYTHYNWGEPNDWNGQEDCLQLLRWNGKWNDNQCGKTGPYICKKYNNTFTPPTTVAPTPGPTLGKCNPGWINYDKSCYKVVDNEVQTWSNARARCDQGTNSSKNGDLVAINNQYEQAFISSLLIKYKWFGFWTGLNDIHTENLFTWINNDQVTYTNWNTRQPIKNKYLDCVDMASGNWAAGQWRVRPCSIKQRYICETPALPLGPTPVTPTASPDCPALFTKYGDSCYSMFYTKLTWNEAREVCSKYEGDLISIHSSYDQAYFLSKMLNFPGNVWTGLKRKANSALFTWSDQSVQEYTHWARGQPGQPGSSRTCVQANNTMDSGGRWTEVSCGVKNGFMCRINKGEPHVTPIEHGTCPPGFKKFDKFCYLFRLWDSQPWSTARFRCNKLAGGDLVSILNQQEKDFLIYQLKDRRWHTWIWTGLNDRVFERGYQWSDNSPVSFTSWALKQPDDHVGRQNCVSMSTKTGLWSDVFCNWKKGYICKAKLECSSPLGMASGNITNAQISASSQMDSAHAPSMGRMNGTSAWCAGNTTRRQYFQVEFMDQMEISKISIQGVMLFLTHAYVRSFTVSYAVYKNQWKPYQVNGVTRTFSSNWNSKKTVTLAADPPIVGRFLRIQPLTWNYKICAKFEFYGCVLDCQKPLGIESGMIRDKLINASSQSDAQHGATQARPVGRSWCPSTSDKSPWLQVTWPGFAKRITKIATWGTGAGTNAYVTKYKLAFSENGWSFTEYQEKGKTRIFRGNSDSNTQLVHVLADPIKTQYFRIIPLSGAKGGVCLRFEIYGCASGCIDPLGMEQGTIEDTWISTSSNLDNTHGPGMARLNAPLGWCVAPTDRKPFLRVFLGRIYRIRKISTQGSPDGKGYVKSFLLRSFLWDVWRYYKERGDRYIFTANHDGSTVISKTFYSPNRALKVEFQPKSWSDAGLCMRVEIYGCIPNNAPTERPSTQPTGTLVPTTPPRELAYKVTMKITNVPWKDDYSDRTTAAFTTLANQIMPQVTALYNRGKNDMASLAFEKAQVIGFRRGSVVVDFNITFFADIAQGVNVMQRIKDTVNTGSLGNLTVDPNSLEITKIETSGGSTGAQTKGRTSGLSTGGKAAIAVVVILIVACGALLAGWWIKKRKSGDMAMKHQTFDNPIHFSSKAYEIDDPLPQPFNSDE